MEFDSILKFIEQDFRLPALTQRNQTASSLLTSLDFKQKPLAPLLLHTRSCPRSDYPTNTTLNGTYLRLIPHPYGKELVMRLKGTTLITLLIGPSTWIGMATCNTPTSLANFQVGDRVQASARPDPQRALVYGDNTLRDLDLKPILRRKGLILEIGQFGQSLNVRFGRRELLVDIGKSTRITLPNGHKGSIADLRTGIGVEVTGVWNTRLDEIISTSSVAVYTLPHGKGKRKP